MKGLKMFKESVKYGLKKINNASVQHINLYKLLEATASIIKHTPKLMLKCLQELIKNLLNFQTTYSIATNKKYQSFLMDFVKLKLEQILAENILIKRKSIPLKNKLSLICRSQ